jgi:hypothetical protein
VVRTEQCGSGELAIWANRVTWREPKPMGDQGRVSARLGSRKCPLCDAGLVRAARATFPIEERSDEPASFHLYA